MWLHFKEDVATLAGGDLMLTQAVESYLEVRRAMGFALHSEGSLLQTFAKYSDVAGKSYICTETAIQWAGVAQSVTTRARELGQVIRLARYLPAEDQRHEIPPAVFGCEKGPRPVPYIFSADNINRLVQAASELGLRNPFRGQTYGAFFALLACTGLRVSEAIRLRFEDVTADGLIIRCSKFRKSRMVPLHSTHRWAWSGISTRRVCAIRSSRLRLAARTPVAGA